MREKIKWVELTVIRIRNSRKNFGKVDVLNKIKELLGLENMVTEELRIERKKIPWNHTFLRKTLEVSKRSHDSQTQNGCVLVRDKREISSGYNGFISDINDEILPNIRPYKYPFMIHAECNAVINCARNGVCSLGATAYVTSEPCNDCLQILWQAGIHTIYYSDIVTNKMLENEEHRRVRSVLLYLMKDLQLHFISSSEFLDKWN